MLRPVLSTGLRAIGTHGRLAAVRTRKSGSNVLLWKSSLNNNNNICITGLHRRTIGYRFLSSSSSDGSKKESMADNKNEKNPEDMNEIVLTPGQKVVAASRLGLWSGIAVFAAVCAYYIGKELIPTKMSPNVVFSRALDKVRESDEVKRCLGTPIKGYGRDHGGKRVGRRNFIEHSEYKSPHDGSNRTRVRFNLEGPRGTAFAFAEVSSEMNSGEFVYVLVQDKADGRLITVEDNSTALAVNRLASGSAEGREALNKLLTGGK